MLRRTTAFVAALATAACLTPVASSVAGAQEGEPFAAQRALRVSSTATLTVAGHGWGHGRGLGQYGSLGYATGHAGSPWNYRQILDHYYGGTTAGTLEDNPWMAVLLKARTGQAMSVYRSTGLQVTGVPGAPTFVSVTLRPDGQYDIQVGLTCTSLGDAPPPPITVPGPVRVDPLPGSGDKALGLCNADGSGVAYRGALVAMAKSFDGAKTGPFIVNLVHMDDLMRGVVPRESPASWGDAAGGAGINALKAQAVAARSYAAAGDTRWGDLHSGLGARATTCDDTFCQVYGGLADVSPTDVYTYKTHANTNRAVAETTNEIRRMASGAVARTEFSSSTGGWTAGGTFPAVEDKGDSVPSNPNHAWSADVAAAAVAEKWQLGALTEVQILERNGLGDQGGRVTKVRLTGSEKSVDLTGNQVRSALQGNGVKSDWFDITAPQVPEPQEPSEPPVSGPRPIDGVCAPVADRAGFVDVGPDNVHRTAIVCMDVRDIAQGTGDGTTFEPAKPVSRAQMATFLARLIYATGHSLPNVLVDPFTDDNRSVHQSSINGLFGAGIANGTSPGRFSPDAPVTRAQMATFISRTYSYIAETDLPEGPDTFGDDDASPHEPAINALALQGIAAGDGSGRFNPDDRVRRDQMASFLARTLAMLDDEGLVS